MLLATLITAVTFSILSVMIQKYMDCFVDEWYGFYIFLANIIFHAITFFLYIVLIIQIFPAKDGRYV